MNPFQQKFDPMVWKIVKSIPAGSVMGYGEVAKAAGFPRYSRMVGASMGRSPDSLPWFRVVRGDRTIAFELGTDAYKEQADLLRLDGVQFDGLKIIASKIEDNLDRILWGPED